MTAEGVPSEDRGSSGPEFGAPRLLGPMDVHTPTQAEQYVRRIRNGFWATTFRIEEDATQPDGYRKIREDKSVSSSIAGMDITDKLFAISPQLHEGEYTPAQISQVDRVIDLILEARERVLVPDEDSPKLQHLYREQDLWADNRFAEIARRKEEDNVTSFPLSNTQIERGSMEAGQAVEF